MCMKNFQISQKNGYHVQNATAAADAAKNR